MFRKALEKSEIEQNFRDNHSHYFKLKSAASSMAEQALIDQRIDFLSMQGRIKDFTSFWEKITRKSYSDPFTQCTDIVAIRFIVFLERDIKKIEHILREIFEIDEENSVDKTIPEKASHVGYRSLHLVCSLGERRQNLPEYAQISRYRFEVQVRTVLQHAWAEIEHKRNYKGRYALPPELEHRLMITAGTLEMVDREFSNISVDAEKYSDSVSLHSSTVAGDPLSQVGVSAIHSTYLAKMGINLAPQKITPPTDEIVNALSDFGISSINELDELVKSLGNRPGFNDFLAERPKISGYANGFFWVAMAFSDPGKFCRLVPKGPHNYFELDIAKDLSKYSNNPNFLAQLKAAGVNVVDIPV